MFLEGDLLLVRLLACWRRTSLAKLLNERQEEDHSAE